MLTIVNYGLGNLGSIRNMFKSIGVDCKISENKMDIELATKLILPGVGSFDKGMELLNKRGYVDILNSKVLIDRVPVLGICLGMQMMGNSSEEGQMNGLGWIDGDCKLFNFGTDSTQKYKIPHMGWNQIIPYKANPLIDGIVNSRFYFVHSYHMVCKNEIDILTITNHKYDFVSAFAKDNIFGVQFHPEKSHKFGMNLLRNFIEKI